MDLNEKEDEKIVTFSESKPLVDTEVTPKELDKTVDEIDEYENKEDEESQFTMSADAFTDSELGMIPEENLPHVRFIPRMEYGTPSGINPPVIGTCSGCGDAGDVAIIDNEIGKDEESKEPGANEDVENRRHLASSKSEDEINEDESFDRNDETSSDEELGSDLEMYYNFLKYKERQIAERKLLGMESLYEDEEDPAERYYKEARWKSIKGFFGGFLWLAGKFLITVTKYANKLYMFTRNALADAFASKETIYKFIKFKLNKLIDRVDEERLLNYKVTTYDFEDLVNTTKCALGMYDIVCHCQNIVENKAADIKTTDIEKIENRLKSVGIELSVKHNKCNLDDNLDRRTNNTLGELGYSKKEIPNLIRYFGEIAKCIPDKKDKPDKMHEITKIEIERIAELRKKLAEQVKAKKIQKGSKKYEEMEQRIVALATRMDYILLMYKATTILFSTLLKDMEDIFGKIENSIEAKALVD